MNDRERRLRTVATLPIRSLHDGKQRLASRLSPEQRGQIIMRLCLAVAGALRESGVVDMISLVSGDDAALAFGESIGLVPLWEGQANLNAALRTAGHWAQEAEAHLIVLPDLPLLQAADVRAVVGAAPETPGVVICPDRMRMGTNLLLMRPSGVIAPSFGPESFQRHLHAAKLARIAVVTVDSPGTRWDIDTPDDLAGLELMPQVQRDR